jgi:hypothetical protein
MTGAGQLPDELLFNDAIAADAAAFALIASTDITAAAVAVIPPCGTPVSPTWNALTALFCLMMA